jgi:hypothetical protein
MGTLIARAAMYYLVRPEVLFSGSETPSRPKEFVEVKTTQEAETILVRIEDRIRVRPVKGGTPSAVTAGSHIEKSGTGSSAGAGVAAGGLRFFG